MPSFDRHRRSKLSRQLIYDIRKITELLSSLISSSYYCFAHLCTSLHFSALVGFVGSVEALVTGLTNKEVAEHLLGLKKRVEAQGVESISISFTPHRSPSS